MGTLRRSRDERPERGPFRVTPRDIELLRAVGRMKVATTDQLRRLFFGDPSTASRRLSKLVALKLLTVTLADMNTPNVYVLTEAAREYLADAGVDASDLHVARAVPRLDPHLRWLNDLRVALTVASRSRNDVAVPIFLADHDLRRAEGSNTYIPDAVVVIEEAGAESVRLLLEVDLGGERAAQFAAKIETTVALSRAGRSVWGLPHPWRPVVLASGRARLQTLSAQIARRGGGDLWIGGLLDHVAADPFGSVFAMAATIATSPVGEPLHFGGRLVRPLAPVP